MMSEEDSSHSLTVNIPKARTFAKVSAFDLKKKNTKKKSCDKVIQKPSDTTLRTYLLPCDTPLRINALKKDTSLLPFKLYAKEQEINKRKKRTAIKLHERNKFINTDLQNRLHVENPPDDVRAITDIDENYFRFSNKHLEYQYIPMYKSLKFQFHDRLRMRQEIGYKQDFVLKIEAYNRKEQEIYERSVQKLTDQVKQLEEFVAKDYKRSMEILKKSEALMVNLNAQILLRENLAYQQFTIQSRLIGLDYLYFVQQKYGRFLYYLSPPSWRAKHREFAHSVEIEAKGFDLGTSSEEDTFNVIFQNMEKECSIGLVKPVLYFSDPDGLMNMFESMEKQHLNHFIHVLSMTSSARDLKKSVSELKNSVRNDTALVAHLIEGFVQLVNFCEEREAQLQARFIKLLNGLFYDTVAAPDVLKLNVNLEFYYEKLYREESFSRNCFATAKALEKIYMELLFKLDSFNNDSLNMAIKRNIKREENKLKKAHVAARELRAFDRMEHAMLRAYEKRSFDIRSTTTATTTAGRTLTRKPKQQYMKPMARLSSQQYSLTEGEIEYLRLFTEWTNNENPAKFLHSLSVANRSNSVNK